MPIVAFMQKDVPVFLYGLCAVQTNGQGFRMRKVQAKDLIQISCCGHSSTHYVCNLVYTRYHLIEDLPKLIILNVKFFQGVIRDFKCRFVDIHSVPCGNPICNMYNVCQLIRKIS